MDPLLLLPDSRSIFFSFLIHSYSVPIFFSNKTRSFQLLTSRKEFQDLEEKIFSRVEVQQRFLPFENCRSFVLSRSRTEFSIAGSNEGMHEKEGKGGKKKKTMVTGIGPRSYGATLRDKSNHFARHAERLN